MRNGVKIYTHDFRQSIPIIYEVWVSDPYPMPENCKTVLDIGANIGAFSLYAQSKGATVLPIEPVTKNSQSLERNGFPRYQFAVGGESGIRTIGGTSSGGASFRDKGNEELVMCVTLKDLVLGPVDMLKMDIEGAEYETLYATPKEVFDKIKHIVLEWHKVDGEDPKELEKYLQKMGYKTKFRSKPHGRIICSR